MTVVVVSPSLPPSKFERTSFCAEGTISVAQQPHPTERRRLFCRTQWDNRALMPEIGCFLFFGADMDEYVSAYPSAK